jgi:hypothetical protein
MAKEGLQNTQEMRYPGGLMPRPARPLPPHGLSGPPPLSHPAVRASLAMCTTMFVGKCSSAAAGLSQSGQEVSPLDSPPTPFGPKPNVTGRVFTHSEVSDIWNSHVDSLFALMNSGLSETR